MKNKGFVIWLLYGLLEIVAFVGCLLAVYFTIMLLA